MPKPTRLTRREFIKLSGAILLCMALIACGAAPTPTAALVPNTPLPTNIPAPTATLIPPTSTPTLQPTSTPVPSRTLTPSRTSPPLFQTLVATLDIPRPQVEIVDPKLLEACSPYSKNVQAKVAEAIAAFKAKFTEQQIQEMLKRVPRINHKLTYPIDIVRFNTAQNVTLESNAIYVGDFSMTLNGSVIWGGNPLGEDVAVKCMVLLDPDHLDEPIVGAGEIFVNVKLQTDETAKSFVNRFFPKVNPSIGDIVSYQILMAVDTVDAVLATLGKLDPSLATPKAATQFGYVAVGKSLSSLGVLGSSQVTKLKAIELWQFVDSQVIHFLRGIDKPVTN
ncbi:MAG: hypothetical protein HZC38_01900 [Chloroflexi bacterium]|nr:hypothetical protein [Chloroflexota bacterium]